MKTETIERPVIVVEALPEMPPVAKLLYQAKTWLSGRGHWTQRKLVNKKTGATCAVGALQKFGPYSWDWEKAEKFLIHELIEIEYDGGIEDFNDTHRKAAVLALFERALNRALAAGK